MAEIRPPTPKPNDAERALAPPGTPLHVVVAPELLDQEHVVVRDDDDSDEDYEAKQRLVDGVLAFARKG